MSKIITWLMLFWLVVLTITGCYIIKAERAFLKFADMVVDDNLKNVVKSGGATYLVVDMGRVAMPGVLSDVPLWSPIYVNEVELDKIIEWKRKQTLMVREFKNINFQSTVIAAQAGRYFKQRLDDLEKRKPVEKQQDHGAYRNTQRKD